MRTIHKSPPTPREPPDSTAGPNVMRQTDDPARPLDLLFPIDSGSPAVMPPLSSGDPQILEPVRFPLFRRIKPRQRKLPAPATVGAPDWSLSIGAAALLIGLAAAFGTYVTLTERDAMQTRMRRIESQNELRATQPRERSTFAERTDQLAQALRNQIAILRSRDAADLAATAGTTAAMQSKAKAEAKGSNSAAVRTVHPPGNPASPGVQANNRTATAKAPAPKTLPPKAVASRSLAPPLPQPAPRTRQASNPAPTRVAATPTRSQQPVKAKPAETTCGKRVACEQVAQQSHKPVKPTKTVAQAKSTTTLANNKVTKKPVKAPVKTAQHPVPLPMNTYSQTEAPAPELSAIDDDRPLYRQH